MKRHIFAWAVIFFAAMASLRADTSYLLVQGPFGPNDAEETFKWQVNYPAGFLETGQDLLTAVFGSPSFSGAYYTDVYSSEYPFWTSQSGTQGAGYIYYPQYGGLFLASLTLDSTTVLQDPSYSPGWIYYVAGGGSNEGAGYDNGGSWTYSNDGIGSRSLANGSFDAWVFGSTSDPPPVDGGENNPTVADFAGATVINLPEPGTAILLLFGAAGFGIWYKKRRYGD